MSAKESPHITALRKQGRLNRLATQRFRVVNGKLEKYKADPVQNADLVLADAIVADKKAREEADAKRIAAAKPGDMVEGHGIFLGTWEPHDRKGSLGKIFNVFAAPEDLQGLMTYGQAAEIIAQLEDWHGYDGTSYADDRKLYEALEKGEYNGGWIIPPVDIWTGCNFEGNPTMPDNLFVNSYVEDFEGLFRATGGDWYWSSTMMRRFRGTDYFNVVELRNGGDMPAPASAANLCHPVRLEPKP